MGGEIDQHPSSSWETRASSHDQLVFAKSAHTCHKGSAVFGYNVSPVSWHFRLPEKKMRKTRDWHLACSHLDPIYHKLFLLGVASFTTNTGSNRPLHSHLYLCWLTLEGQSRVERFLILNFDPKSLTDNLHAFTSNQYFLWKLVSRQIVTGISTLSPLLLCG